MVTLKAAAWLLEYDSGRKPRFLAQDAAVIIRELLSELDSVKYENRRLQDMLAKMHEILMRDENDEWG